MNRVVHKTRHRVVVACLVTFTAAAGLAEGAETDSSSAIRHSRRIALSGSPRAVAVSGDGKTIVAASGNMLSASDAMKEGDRDSTSLSMTALAREFGPRQAYGHLWMYGAERNHNSGGHTAISVANTWRTMQATDWRCAETALQFAIKDAGRVPGGSNLHAINRERADRVAELPPQWSSIRSDRGAVLELLDLYRKGDPADLPPNNESLEEIFSLLPPRRFSADTRVDFKDVDRAVEIAFAWAKDRTDFRPFLQTAERLMCVKATPEVHDFKFPMALFENCRYASPRWRPCLLAASVHVLQGTDMEDSQIVQQARETLRG
jgi:hypothetical protein